VVTNKQFGHLPYACCSCELMRFRAHAGRYPERTIWSLIRVFGDDQHVGDWPQGVIVTALLSQNLRLLGHHYEPRL
jgi:hypothetical protein